MTLPGFMLATISAVMSLGAGLPGMSAVVTMMSASGHCLAYNAAALAVSPVKKPVTAARRFTVAGVVAAVFFVLAALSPPALQPHLTVFALAIVIGYYVIGHVHHALHTPLMSVTNAISGIIVVGALLEIGQGNAWVTALSAVAILLASINIFGGFAVTRRMLSMFSRS